MSELDSVHYIVPPKNVPSGNFFSLNPFIEVNRSRYYKNGIKISDVAYPSYFPIEYTYRVGNGEIIRLARLTRPVSQDNFGTYSLIVFCTDGIYTMGVDRTGNGVYTDVAYFNQEVCTNRNSICEIGGAIIFASDKGLMMMTSEGVEEFTPHLNGPIMFAPSDTADNTKDGQHIYHKLVTTNSIVDIESALSTNDFIDYLQNENTVVSYVSKKKKIVVYNKDRNYIYIIDIATRNTTKLFFSVAFDDDNSPTEEYWKKVITQTGVAYRVTEFGYNSQIGKIECLIQSRPIKVQQDDKCSYRVVISGYFEGNANKWSELVVLGSLDGDHWRAIGIKEKKLNGGFHNLGCITERGSWKYLMFIFAGDISNKSHIDSIDITVDGRYNNKKR